MTEDVADRDLCEGDLPEEGPSNEALGKREAMAERFSPLSLKMLNDSPLMHAWRLNFIANFFTGPIYRQLGERFGVSRPEFVILFCLLQKPGLVARDVCLVTGLPKNSISRAVSELLKKGYIARDTDDADKRAKPLSLTEQGRATLAAIVPLVRARQDAMRDALDREEQADFDRLVMKIVYGMPTWVQTE